MIAYSKNHADQICDNDQIDKIAACLADNFLKPLYHFCNEKNYFVYVACLAEILDWSHEFYNQYYNNVNDWEAFEEIKDNVYNTGVYRNNFLIVWGDKRIKQFFAQNSNKTKCSRKYLKNSKNKQNNFSIKIGT